MSEDNDLTYFASRAETERALAGESATPQIAALHMEMAELYEALVSAKVVGSSAAHHERLGPIGGRLVLH